MLAGVAALHGLGDWGLGPVHTLDGPIPDPGNTPPTDKQCIPYMCGLDPNNAAVRFWCSYWGKAASKSCFDADCAPYVSQIPFCSLPKLPPSVPPPPRPPQLTAKAIVQPMPDITVALAPVVVEQQPDCPPAWCQISQAIEDHPIAALLIVAGAAYLLWPQKRGRG